MSTLNGLYIFVSDEQKSYSVNVTEHTVETGVDITDHVKNKGITLSITGEIVGNNADSTLSKIKQLQSSGTLCKYTGRTILTNCLITEFNVSHPHTIWGGCEFSMTLKEVRTAATSYTPTVPKKTETNKTGTQQVTKNSKTIDVYHTVKKGDTIWSLVASNNAPYKKYGMSCNQVMKMNPTAFSRKNDFGTLQIGSKIKIGTRQVQLK